MGGPQQRRLLALLLSRPGQPVSSERLVDCLWPDGLAPTGAGRSVMTYVSRLRAALGKSPISSVEEGYRLELGDSTIDAQQFETLLAEAGTEEPGRALEIYDRALALWRGSAYGEFGAEWWRGVAIKAIRPDLSGEWLNVSGYEQAGRAAAAHPGTTAFVVVHDIRQALAFLCGRTGNATTCAIARTAASIPIGTP